MRQKLADYRVFWRQFRDAYNSTGAVLPSGAALCAALSRFVRDGDAHVDESLRDSNSTASERLPHVISRRILEVGPGTGAVTARIIRDMRPNDVLVLVERNEEFVKYLNERLDDFAALNKSRDRIRLVHSSVEDLPEDEPYDVIISGLPLNNFNVELVDSILTKLRRLLAPTGTLSFFEYVAIRRFKSAVSTRADRERLRGIERVLGEVLNKKEVCRDLVMANVPPAWVHHVRFGEPVNGNLGQGAS